MTGDFVIKAFPKSHGLDGEISISSGAVNMYDYLLAMDWDNNCLAAQFMYQTGTPSYDPYILFYVFDWTTVTCRYLNYCYPTTNYQAAYSPAIMFWKTFEGERMLFWTTHHSNGNAYAFKYRQYNILNIPAAATDIAGTTLAGPTGTWATQMVAFTDATVAGTRNVRSEFTQVLGATGRFLAWCWNGDETELLILKYDDTAPGIYLVTLHFGRTTNGINPHKTFLFDIVPTTGNWSIQVTNTRTAATGTSASLAYNATNAQIKTAIEAIATVGAGNASVTGSYATGIRIEITSQVKDPMTIVVPSDTLDANISDGTFSVGASSVWLTHPPSTNTTTVYQYSQLGSIIILDLAVQPAVSVGYAAAASPMYGRNELTQRMCAVGDTVYICIELAETNNDVDAYRTRFIKIPNYKELRGLHTGVSTGTLAAVGHLANSALAATAGRKLAQIITIPTNANTGVVSALAPTYTLPLSAAGFIPFRTISLYLSNTYATQKAHNPNHKIKLSIYPVSAGLPDTTVAPLAESSFMVPEIAITPFDDYKWYTFCFNSFYVSPGQQIAVVVEPNWDPTLAAELNPTGLSTTTRGYTAFGGATTLTGACKLNDAGTTWSTMASGMWYKLFDFYNMHLSDAQDNPYYQHPCQLNNAFTNEDFESSVAFIGDKNDRDLRVIYRNSDYGQFNSTSYTGEGAHAKTFVGKVVDSLANAYGCPTFEEPTLLGDNGQADPFLMFGLNFGSEESRLRDPRLNVAVYPGLVSGSTTYVHEGYNQRAIGGIRIESASSNNIYSLFTRTSALDGVIENTSFAYGKALRFNGGYIQYRYGTYGLFPGPKDFCVEFEYLPATQDLDGTQNILISHEGSIRVSINANKWESLMWGNPSETFTFRAAETVQQVYQRVRVGRTFASGAFIHVSYDSGETWTALTLSGLNNPMLVSGGRVLGLQSTYYDQLIFGRYADLTTTYQCFGSMGYFKYIIGNDEPAYDGPVRYDSEYDFRRILNFGDKVFAMRPTQNSSGNSTVNIAEGALIYPDQNTSKVETRDQLFKYYGSVPQGNKPSLRIALYKKSSLDPMALQGILFNYEKK